LLLLFLALDGGESGGGGWGRGVKLSAEGPAIAETLEELGKQFGVTRERIRQLQNDALSKLRRARAALKSDIASRRQKVEC